MNLPGGFWTDERVELLKKLFADGLTGDRIAVELHAKSRSVVLGKLHRLGLLGRGKVVATEKPGKVTATNGPKRGGKNTISILRAKERAEEDRQRTADGKLSPMKIEARPEDVARVTQMDLTNDACRFPVGSPADATFGFCGALEADLAAGRPYCPTHAARCFTGAPARAVSVPGSVTPSKRSFDAFEREGAR